MGQRLLFKMHRGKGETTHLLCAIHFHWSAYTLDCYQTAKMLIRGLKKYNYRSDMTDKETLQIIINILESNVTDITESYYRDKDGVEHVIPRYYATGGVAKNSMDICEKMGLIFNREHVNRSEGLLIVGEDNIETSIDMEEDTEDFFIDGEFFTNDLFSTMEFSSVKDIIPDIKLDDIPDYYAPCDPSLVSFCDIDKMIHWILELRDKNPYDWILGKYYHKDVWYIEISYT